MCNEKALEEVIDLTQRRWKKHSIIMNGFIAMRYCEYLPAQKSSLLRSPNRQRKGATEGKISGEK